MFTKDELIGIRTLLERADLKGSEVRGFVQLCLKIEDLIQKADKNGEDVPATGE